MIAQYLSLVLFATHGRHIDTNLTSRRPATCTQAVTAESCLKTGLPSHSLVHRLRLLCRLPVLVSLLGRLSCIPSSEIGCRHDGSTRVGSGTYGLCAQIATELARPTSVFSACREGMPSCTTSTDKLFAGYVGRHAKGYLSCVYWKLSMPICHSCTLCVTVPLLHLFETACIHRCAPIPLSAHASFVISWLPGCQNHIW